MRFFIFCHQILSILTIDANIGSCPRTTLPLPHGLFHFAPLLRPHASTLKDDLIVFKEEEYHFYIVPCLDHGDPPTARETGEEMSNESAELEDEDIQRDTKDLTTRSGRKSRRPRESLFLFYY